MATNQEGSMNSITICIGNSDDKLTQTEWAMFVSEIHDIIDGTLSLHFHGFAPANMPWQNACWVGVCDDEQAVESMLKRIKNCRMAYKQDSVAVIRGESEFV